MDELDRLLAPTGVTPSMYPRSQDSSASESGSSSSCSSSPEGVGRPSVDQYGYQGWQALETGMKAPGLVPTHHKCLTHISGCLELSGKPLVPRSLTHCPSQKQDDLFMWHWGLRTILKSRHLPVELPEFLCLDTLPQELDLPTGPANSLIPR